MNHSYSNNSSSHLQDQQPHQHGGFPFRWVLYAICFIGITLNCAVFFKRKNMSRRQSTTTRLSLSLLCAMAAADTISLGALLFMLNSRYLASDNLNMMNLICKVDLFLIHAASAFSIWCWLVLSAVRYVAIYRPYTHLKLSSEPKLAAAAVAVLCASLEAWILIFVGYLPEPRVCGEMLPDSVIQRLHLFEIGWTYFFPVLVITILDARVLFHRSIWSNDLPPASIPLPPPSSMERAAQTATVIAVDHHRHSKTSLIQNSQFDKALKRTRSRGRRIQLRVLRRCLCITVLDLGMNLPNYLFRLLLAVASDEQSQRMEGIPLFKLVEDISNVLYFAQFSLNALYLVCIIYDSPSKRSQNRQEYTSKSDATSVIGCAQLSSTRLISNGHNKPRTTLITQTSTDSRQLKTNDDGPKPNSPLIICDSLPVTMSVVEENKDDDD